MAASPRSVVDSVGPSRATAPLEGEAMQGCRQPRRAHELQRRRRRARLSRYFGHTRRMRQLLVLSLFFLSGAAALIYEVSWSRLIGLQVGHTVQAAAVTLAAYFVGMAVGSHWSARWLPRVQRPFLVYAAAELVVAAWALLTPSLVVLVDGLGIHSLAGRAALS